HDMVVPTVGVVVCNDYRGVTPFWLRLKKVDDVNQELLLIERVRVARVSVAVSRSFQERHSGEVSRFHRGIEIPNVVLMICGVSLMSDHRDRCRPRMVQVGRRRIVLEWLMVRNVV